MAAFDVNMKGNTKVFCPVRNIPSIFGIIQYSMIAGTSINISKVDGDWYYITQGMFVKGWVRASEVEITENYDTFKIIAVSKEEQEEAARNKVNSNNQSELEKQLSMIEDNLGESQLSDQEIIDSLIIHNLNGIYGVPYQFMESVDPRLVTADGVNTEIGRKYSERIISKMPLLYITPGRVKFMSNFSKEDKKGILAKLISGDSDTDINDIIKNNGKYFTFEFAYDDYFTYVNSLCNVGAKFLEIQNLEVNIGGENNILSGFQWEKALNKSLKATVSSQEFIGFYMDSTDSVTESFSNNTSQSQIASGINSMSTLGQELGFLMGAGAGIQYDNIVADSALTDLVDGIDDIAKKYLSGGFLKDLSVNFSTIAVGGKLLFPEIWSDSEFSRDFSISLKLRTPDSDVVSWYLNIYVPLCHLIALAAGHQTNNPNGYHSPFLVRAYYKGLFNINMGIITDLTIRKGKEAAWNIDGLPTEVDVDITIKDLYNMLSIVPGLTEPKNFVTNDLLMDYVANTCGVNINKMDIEREIEVYYILARNKFIGLPNRTLRTIQNSFDNYITQLYEKSLRTFLI